MGRIVEAALPYEPLPKLRSFHESDASLRYVQGGYGSGKTTAGVAEAIDVAMAYPGNVGLLARKTYREIDDTLRPSFFALCPEALIKEYRAKEERVIFVNGSEIVFRSLDDPKKFGSLNLGFVYVDEASEILDESIPLALIGRLRLNKVPWRGAWFTSNPCTVDHWLYEWFAGQKATEAAAKGQPRFFLRLASYDNPYLPQEYIKQLEQEYSPQWARRYLLGEFGFLLQGDSVFPMFDERRHVVADIVWLHDRPIIRGWDFGWYRPAVVFAQVGPNGQLLVLREYLGHKIYLEKFAEEILHFSMELYPGVRFIDVGDPYSGPQHTDKSPYTNVEILRRHGIHLQMRRVDKKRMFELINRKLLANVRTRDGQEPAVLFSRKGCPTLIEAMQGAYCWPKPVEGKLYREDPLEDGLHEHPTDAFRYICSHVWLGAGEQTVRIESPVWAF